MFAEEQNIHMQKKPGHACYIHVPGANEYVHHKTIIATFDHFPELMLTLLTMNSMMGALIFLWLRSPVSGERLSRALMYSSHAVS